MSRAGAVAVAMAVAFVLALTAGPAAADPPPSPDPPPPLCCPWWSDYNGDHHGDVLASADAGGLFVIRGSKAPTAIGSQYIDPATLAGGAVTSSMFGQALG